MENLSQICLTSWLALTIGVTLLAAYLIIAAPVARKKSNVTRYFRALAVVGAVLLVSAVPAWIGPASTGRNGRSGGNILPRVSGSPIYLYTIGMTGVSGTDNAHFNNPYGVTVNATGHVYVVDTGNHRVQVFNSDGTYQNTIGTTGASGADNAHFNTPYGVAVNATGHVYVADTGNRRVQVFDSAGTYQYTIGTTRVAGTDSAHFNTPVGVAVNATGHVFVTDYGNHRVQVFDSAGTYQYTIGMTGVSGTDNFHFYCPFGVAVNNATGYIYVTDVGNHRVQVFDSAGTYQYTIGTAGVSGTDNAHFNTPYGVAVNATGYVYVADMGNYRVQVFHSDKVYLFTIGVTGVGGSDNAHFNTPAGVAVNASGHIYVADPYNDRVQVFEIGILSRVAGIPIFLYTIGTTGVSAADNTHFNTPNGVAVNATGHVYVADTGNHRVQVFDKAGTYQYTIGVSGEYGDDNAHFNTPYGVAVNATGHVYVVDTGNNRVQVFDNAGVYQYTISGFSYPMGVAMNATGHVYVADTGNYRVQVFDKAGTYQYTIGVSGEYGDDNAHFAAPAGVAVHNATGYLYVADAWNYRVQVFDNAGTYQYTLGASVGNPNGVAVDATGHVYVTDLDNHRVQVFDNAGTYQYTIGTAGVSGADNTHFNTLYGIAVDATGHVYVADSNNHRIQVFGAGLFISINNGAVETSTLAVTLMLDASDATEMCFSNDGTTYTDWEPFSTTKVWILDGGMGLKTVYFKGKYGTTEVGPITDTITYTLQPSGLSILIDGGAAETGSTSVTLTVTASGASEMCFSNNGTTYTAWEAYSTTKAWTLDAVTGRRTVYFKARNGTIEAAAPATDTITYAAPSGLSISINNGAAITSSTLVTLTMSATGATQMCFSNDGITYTAWEAYGTSKAWVLDEVAGIRTVYFKARNGTYEAAAPATDTITYAPGSPIYAYTIGNGYGSDNAHFASPYGVAVDATGYAYVADTDNHRVQVFYSEYLNTIGVTGVTGTDNFHFFFPEGVAVNTTGHLYVADSWNHRVQVFNSAGTYQYTIGTTGALGSDNAHFNMPKGVAVNATGYVYVADTYNNRIQVFDSTGTYQYTIGVTGVTGSDNAHLASPSGVAVNATGHLYVVDQGNCRVQVFDKAGIYQYTIGTGAGIGNYQFNQPYGVAVHNATGFVYVADMGNHRVQVFDCAGVYRSTIGVSGVSGSDNTHFDYPAGVAVDATGHVYVTEINNHRVQVFDPPAPTGLSVTINGGATETATLAVTLTLAATGATEMCFSNNGTTYTSWEAYSTTKVWTLVSGSGLKTVYFKARCHTSVAAPVSDTITLVGPPTDMYIGINSGAPETVSTSVVLLLFADNASEMCFSNNGTTYTDWEAYKSSKVWTLDSIPGVRTVYFKARNVYGESGPVTDNITYILPPLCVSIYINGVAAETGTASVSLNLVALNAAEMCFSNNGTTYTDWEAYKSSKAWTLDSIPGVRTVYFKVRNSTFVSGPVSDTITYVVPPSSLSVTIDGGAEETGTTSVTLALSATGATQMCFSNNGTTYTNWEAYGPSKPWTLDAVPGVRTVYFKARNGTIEASAWVIDTITYVVPPSALSISINGGAADISSTSVTLTLSATGATQMCFSNNGTTFTDWEAYGPSKLWTIDAVPGIRTVYFKARNGTIEAAAPATGTITYTLPPAGLTVTFSGGATDTATSVVTLVVWAMGATEMCFSNDLVTWSAWEPFTSAKTWGLMGGPGPKTVYFNARNGTIEAIVPVSATIIYRLRPSGLAITINDGAAETGSTDVTLTLSATGATEMCFSNDGMAWSIWEPFAASKTWALAGGAGYKTVYFKARNGTIEVVSPVVDTITYVPSTGGGGGIPGYPVAVLLAVTGLATLSLRRRVRQARRAPRA